MIGGRWWKRRHADVAREELDRRIAEKQLCEAQDLSARIGGASEKLQLRRLENGFGASVAASMQPRRGFPWRR